MIVVVNSVVMGYLVVLFIVLCLFWDCVIWLGVIWLFMFDCLRCLFFEWGLVGLCLALLIACGSL